MEHYTFCARLKYLIIYEITTSFLDDNATCNIFVYWVTLYRTGCQCNAMRFDVNISYNIKLLNRLYAKKISYFYMFCDWNICDIFQTIICQSFCNRSGLKHIYLFVCFLTPNDRYSRFLIVVFNSFAHDFVQIKCFTHVANA